MSPNLPPRNPAYRAAMASFIAIGTLAVMLFSEPDLSIVWDEGYTLGREARVRDWLRALRDPPGFAASWRPPDLELVQPDRVPLPPPRPEEIDTRAELFSPRVLAWFWPFAREEPHGHPPFYAIVGMVGDLIAPGLAPLPRARLGPMIAFSLTAGALFGWFARRYGTWAAALAAGAWVLQPRLFGHGHYATYDALLSALWVGSILAFDRAVSPGEGRWPRWGWAVAFGVLAGWAADTKFTAWLLPLPFLAWTALYRDRRGLLTLAVGGLVGVVVLYLFNPTFWADPIGGVGRFLWSNLSRGRTIPIGVQFLGRVYKTPVQSLPWYNTLAWTLFVTPVGFLSLAVLGVFRSLRRWRAEPFGALAVGHWAFLLALRALPHTPGHDGVRQFLPAFGVLAIVAGLGAASALERLGCWGKVWGAAALVEGAVSIALMMPVPLAYYSPIVGGLPGATRLGMEPTYYWDGLTGAALDWLNDHTPRGGRVAFSTFPHSFFYLKETGRLRPEVDPRRRDRPAWFVLQNRPGEFPDLPFARPLLARGRPSFVVAKWGVPLVLIYPYTEFERVTGR